MWVLIRSIIMRKINQESSSYKEEKESSTINNNQLMKEVLVRNMNLSVEMKRLEFLDPNIYYWKDKGEYK